VVLLYILATLVAGTVQIRRVTDSCELFRKVGLCLSIWAILRMFGTLVLEIYNKIICVACFVLDYNLLY